MFSINILWTGEEDLQERARIEQLIAAWQDFAYGYDVEEEFIERLKETLDEIGLEYEITENEEE